MNGTIATLALLISALPALAQTGRPYQNDSGKASLILRAELEIDHSACAADDSADRTMQVKLQVRTDHGNIFHTFAPRCGSRFDQTKVVGSVTCRATSDMCTRSGQGGTLDVQCTSPYVLPPATNPVARIVGYESFRRAPPGHVWDTFACGDNDIEPPYCDPMDPGSWCYVPPPCDPLDPFDHCYCNPDDPASDCYEPPECDPTDRYGRCYCNPDDPASDCYEPPPCDPNDRFGDCYCNENDPASDCYEPPCDPNDPASDCYEPPCDPSDPWSDCYVDPCDENDPSSYCYDPGCGWDCDDPCETDPESCEDPIAAKAMKAKAPDPRMRKLRLKAALLARTAGDAAAEAELQGLAACRKLAVTVPGRTKKYAQAGSLKMACAENGAELNVGWKTLAKAGFAVADDRKGNVLIDAMAKPARAVSKNAVRSALKAAGKSAAKLGAKKAAAASNWLMKKAKKKLRLKYLKGYAKPKAPRTEDTGRIEALRAKLKAPKFD